MSNCLSNGKYDNYGEPLCKTHYRNGVNQCYLFLLDKLINKFDSETDKSIISNLENNGLTDEFSDLIEEIDEINDCFQKIKEIRNKIKDRSIGVNCDLKNIYKRCSNWECNKEITEWVEVSYSRNEVYCKGCAKYCKGCGNVKSCAMSCRICYDTPEKLMEKNHLDLLKMSKSFK